MLLLPTQQTTAQLTALRRLVETGHTTLREPCNCGSQIRHNNGGNYHAIVDFRLDGGKVWRSETFTGDYGIDRGKRMRSEAMGSRPDGCPISEPVFRLLVGEGMVSGGTLPQQERDTARFPWVQKDGDYANEERREVK